MIYNNTTIRESGIRVTGNNNVIHGHDNVVTGNNNKIAGNNNGVTGNNNTIYGSGCVITGNNNEATGLKNKMFGNNNDNKDLEDAGLFYPKKNLNPRTKEGGEIAANKVREKRKFSEEKIPVYYPPTLHPTKVDVSGMTPNGCKLKIKAETCGREITCRECSNALYLTTRFMFNSQGETEITENKPERKWGLAKLDLSDEEYHEVKEYMKNFTDLLDSLK